MNTGFLGELEASDASEGWWKGRPQQKTTGNLREELNPHITTLSDTNRTFPTYQNPTRKKKVCDTPARKGGQAASDTSKKKKKKK